MIQQSFVFVILIKKNNKKWEIQIGITKTK